MLNKDWGGELLFAGVNILDDTGVKEAGSKKGPAEKVPIRYVEKI